MSLINCKECNQEVSSKAESCPKCGARIARPPMGCGAKLVLLFFIFVAIIVIWIFGDGGPADRAVQLYSAQEEALSGLSIKDYSWGKSRFGNGVALDITIQNNGKQDVKDVEVECRGYSKTHTLIDSNKKVIYENIPAGKSISKKKFNMGYVLSEVDNINCKITDVVVVQ
jgi:hypothetical protein